MKKLLLVGLVGCLSTGLFAQDFTSNEAQWKIYNKTEKCQKADIFEAQQMIEETNSGKRYYISGLIWGPQNNTVNIFSNDKVLSRNVQNVVYYFNSQYACQTFKAEYEKFLPMLTRKGN